LWSLQILFIYIVINRLVFDMYADTRHCIPQQSSSLFRVIFLVKAEKKQNLSRCNCLTKIRDKLHGKIGAI